MAKQDDNKKDDKSVSVDVPGKDSEDVSTELGSESNPLHFMRVFPDAAPLEEAISTQDEDDPVQHIKNEAGAISWLAEQIALRVLSNPDSRHLLKGNVMAPGKCGDHDSQAAHLAAESFTYAKQLRAALNFERETEITKQIGDLKTDPVDPSEAEESGDNKASEES